MGGAYCGNGNGKTTERSAASGEGQIAQTSEEVLAFVFDDASGFGHLFINNYLPIGGLFIAFKDINYTKGIFQSDWIGFKNFEYLFRTKDAWTITRNTLLYNVGFIILNLVIAVFLAILISEVTKLLLRRVYQTIILVPYLISMVIVGYLVFALLSADTGFINNTLFPALGKEPIMWYSEPKYWPVILNLVNVWKNAGYYCIIYLAAIMGIDPTYYEAATIDGASAWKKVTSITLPCIAPVIITMVLLQIGRIFYSDFGLFYQVPMDSGALMSTTNVIDTYVYRGLLTIGDIGMSSAAGLYQSVVGFVMVLLSNLVVRKLSPENALF